MRVQTLEKKAMRLAFLVALIGSVFADVAVSAGEGFPFGGPPKRAREEWREKINAALTKPISTDFKAMPANDAIAFFKEKTAVNFVIDPKSTPAKWPAITVKQNNVPAGDAMKAALKTVAMDFSVRDGVVFVFDPKKVDMDMLKSEDMLVAKMLEGRPEMLDFQPQNAPAGEMLKALTEPANIKMSMDAALQKNPITLDLKEVKLGHAIRWLVRLAGGEIVVTRDGMNVVKR
jgi:hypothetical protein